MAKPRGPRPQYTKQIPARLTPEQYDALVQQAFEEGTSVAALIRRAVDEYLWGKR